MPNSKRHLLFLIALLAATLGTNLPAQATETQVPTPPFVANAPASSSWKIAVTYKRSYPEPAEKGSTAHEQWKQLQKILPAITKIAVSKSGNRLREVTDYAQGTSDERYCVEGMQFLRMATFVPGDISVGAVTSNQDFPELGWITLENFTGIQTAQEKKCFVFVSESEGDRKEAWIDATTKLPVKFNDATYDRLYEFLPLKPSDLDPSPAIAKRVAACIPVPK